MAKLALLALALAAIVAFSEVSADKTTITITTTTIEDNGVIYPFIYDSLPVPREECRRQIQGQQLSHCRMHLTQVTSNFDHKLRMSVENPSHLQLCCNELRQLDHQCQCQAIQRVFNQAQTQQQRTGPRATQQFSGQQQLQQILRKTQMLPNQCNLQVRQCPIQIPRPRV